MVLVDLVVIGVSTGGYGKPENIPGKVINNNSQSRSVVCVVSSNKHIIVDVAIIYDSRITNGSSSSKK